MPYTEFLFGLAERPTDLARLVVVPVFAWAAWQDVEVRRVPNKLWPPLLVLGVALLAIDARYYHGIGGFTWQRFLIGTGVSVLLVIPLVYVFWLLGGFGGADVKALATLAIVFPTFPRYFVGEWALPLVDTHANAFAFTVLTNAVVVGLLYPLALGASNVARGVRSRWMFLGRRVRWDALPGEHGRLLEDPEGFTRRGLDVDALRMYLRWRGLDLAELRDRADELRDPATLPAEPNPPTDGAVATDGGRPTSVGDDGEPDESETAAGPATVDAAREASDRAGRDDAAVAADSGGAAGEDREEPDDEYDDPWGAATFLEDIDHGAYGTDAETLRDGLDLVVERDEIWLSPGIPFIVPVLGGLLVALTYGDLLFGLVQWLGVA